jgi:N-acetylglutamate synthase-like GNAT family acetyltransferase
MISIHHATNDEFAYVVNRLKAVDMMWEDIDPARSQFWVAEQDGKIMGFARLELRQGGALMGSLYVEPAYRKAGLGRAIAERVEAEAREQGRTHLYVFSTGAGAFFLKHGYVEVPVLSVVTAIPDSPQVEWYVARPEELAAEVTYGKSLVK